MPKKPYLRGNLLAGIGIPRRLSVLTHEILERSGTRPWCRSAFGRIKGMNYLCLSIREHPWHPTTPATPVTRDPSTPPVPHGRRLAFVPIRIIAYLWHTTWEHPWHLASPAAPETENPATAAGAFWAPVFV